MAKTAFGVNHSLSNKVWSKTLAAEAIRKTWIGKFIGTSESSLIMEKVDLKKDAGDKITCGLNFQLEQDGVQGDATLEGNEEALQFYNDSIFIDQLRFAVRINGRMTEKRVPYNLRKVARDRLSDLWAARMDLAFFNQICGNINETDTRYTGNQATLAATSNRIFRPNARSNDETLVAGDEFSLELVDYARELAMTSSTAASTGPLVRPLMIDGSEMYVMFLHDFQVVDLRTNTSTGQWLDIQKAALAGGDVSKNPIFTGALGVYNGVVLHNSSRITTGRDGGNSDEQTDVRRAVLCGAQAALIAFGGNNSASKMTWVEKTFDYDNQLGVAAGCIWGLKKTVYAPESGSTNQEDYGCIVVPTFAVNHTS